LEPTAAAYRLLYRTSFASAAGKDPALTWGAAYGTVAGVLPLGELPRFIMGESKRPVAFVRTRLDVSTGGKVKLHLKSAKGLTLWVDQEPVEVGKDIVLDLKTGVHTLTIAIDLNKRRGGLSCELRDVSGSKARARVVGGK
jgi:hypothetical protein